MGWLNFDASKVGFEALEKLRKELQSWDALTFLEKVRQFFNKELDPEDTAKIQLAIDILGLSSQVDAVGELVGKIPPGAWNLFERLSQVSDRFSLPLLNQGDRFQTLDGPWSSSLGFDLTSEIGINAFSARQNIEMLPDLEVPSGVAFFHVEGVGRLSVEAGGSLALTGGGLNVGVQAGGQVELAYLFKETPSTLVITALLEHGKDLVPPFSLEKIGAAHQKHLHAIHFLAQGDLAFSAGVEIGQTWGNVVSVESDLLEVDSKVDFELSAAASLSANVTMAGGFDLLIQPQENGKVSVKLKKSKDRSRTLGFNLNTQIGITGLDVIGQAILDKYIPDAQPWIDELRPFLDLGNLIRREISGNLGGFLAQPENQVLRDQLVQVVTGAATSEALEAAVLATIENQANGQLEQWTREAEALSSEVLNKAADRFELTGQARELFLDELSVRLNEVIGKARENLQTRLERFLADKAGEELRKLLEPLENFGAEVDELVNQTQDLVNLVLEPVLLFLNRYQSYRNKIQAAVDGAARLKVGLDFSRAYASTVSGGVMLDLLIDPAVGQAREYFRQILWGSFRELMAQLQKATLANPVAGVEVVGGSFSKRLGKRVTTDFSVDLGDFKALFSSSREVNLNVTWDLAGNIEAASGNASVEKVSSIGREKKSASFVNLLELAGGMAALPSKIFSSSVSLAYEDERIRISEIRGHLGSLEKTGLLPEGTTDKTIARYDAMDLQHVGAAISLSFPLQGEDLRVFLEASEDEILLKGFENNLMVFETNTRMRNGVLKFLDTRFTGGDRLAKIKFILNKAGDLSTAERLVSKTPRQSEKRNSRKLWLYGRNAQVLVNMQKIMKKVAAISLVGPQREDNLNEVKTLLNQFNREVSSVLKTGNLLRQFVTDRVPKPTLAFIATLRELAQGSEEPVPLIPVIRWLNDGQPVDEILI